MKNVKGLLSANKGKAFPMIVKEFEKAGYHIHFKLKMHLNLAFLRNVNVSLLLVLETLTIILISDFATKYFKWFKSKIETSNRYKSG